MPTEDLLLRLKVEGGRVVSEEIDRAERSTSRYEEATRRAHKSTSLFGEALGGLKGAAGFALGVGGLTGLGFGLAEAVRKAEEFQNVTAQLRASLKANVKAPVDAATESMVRFSEHLSMHGGFAPPEEIQALTQLVRVTHDVSKAQQDLTLATNIARGSHKDLATAVRAVAMVEGGRLGMLTRLGIVLPKHTTALQAMTILQQRYAGATTAYNRTAEGAFSNLTNTLDILGEKIGKMLVPYIQTAVTWLSHFVDQAIAGKGAGGQFKDVLVAVWKEGLQPAGRFIGSVVGGVKNLISGFREGKVWAVALVGALAGLSAAAAAIWVIVTATRAWAAIQAILDVEMLANPIGLMIVGVAALGAAIAVLVVKFPRLWQGLKHGLQDVVNWIIARLNDVIGAYNSIVSSIPGIGHDLTLGKIGPASFGNAPRSGPPPNSGRTAGIGRTDQRAFMNTPLVWPGHPTGKAGDTVIHTHLNIDGQQVGRALSRVGLHQRALQ